MDRRIVTVLAALLLAAFLASCASTPTGLPLPTDTPAAKGTPSATPTGGPSPTAMPTATPTPVPAPTLTKADLATIGVGMAGSWIRYLAYPGQSPEALAALPIPASCALEGGGSVAFTYSTYSEIQLTNFVASIVATDADGTRTVLPKPDASPVQDFSFRKGSLVLPFVKAWESVEYGSLVAAFGTPLSVADEDVVDDWGHPFVKRIAQFSGLRIELWQGTPAKDPDVWTYGAAEASDAAIATPRGLRCGLTLAEVAAMLGTGDFQYTVDASGEPDGLEYSILKSGQDMGSLYTDITLEILGGVVAKVSLSVHVAD